MYLFSDGSELGKVSRPQDLLYMKLLKHALDMFGAWPRKLFGEKNSKYYFIRTILTLSAEAVIIVPEIIYIKDNVGKLGLFEIGHSYITTLMTMMATSRITVFLFDKYFETTSDFIKIIHLFNHEAKSEYAKKVHLQVHKLCHFLAMHLLSVSILGFSLFNLTPLFTNIWAGAFLLTKAQNRTLEHSVYYSLPFDYLHAYPGYIFVFVFNVYISISASSSIATLDCLMSSMVFHLWGHLRILSHDLENFPKPDNYIGEGKTRIPWYSKDENERVFKTLKEYIVYHRLITSFASQMSTVFGPALLVYYAFNQISGCILLLECSLMELRALARYLPLTVVLNQLLIQVSVVFELLKSKSESLPDSVYHLPWEYMDTRNRKLVYILLFQTQKSMSVKAAGMVSVGVQSTAAILKTTVSYFVMLRTLAN